MFYQESQIDDILKCDMCKDRLVEPKCLPCGNTVCNKCISDRLDENEPGLKCELCHHFHTMPKEGFVDNKKVIKLLDKHPGEVCRTRLEKNLRSYLRELKSQTDKFVDLVKDPSFMVKDHCASIRIEVNLTKDDTIKAISNDYDEIIRKINKYERDCLDALKKDNRIINKIAEIEDRVNLFYQSWEDYLSNFVIDESHLVSAQQDAQKLMRELENNDLKILAFNGKVIKFSKNNDLNKTPILGFLNIDETYEDEYEED